MEQLDKLDQYTTSATEGATAGDGELGELSQKFYQAAVQVCVHTFWKKYLVTLKGLAESVIKNENTESQGKKAIK